MICYRCRERTIHIGDFDSSGRSVGLFQYENRQIEDAINEERKNER